MYQRDWLMRQIEQAAQALGRILKKALGGDPAEALAMFDQAYRPLLGVSSRVVSTLTEEQLVSLLTSGSSPDLRRVASVLEVIETEAGLYAQTGQEREANHRHLRALGLAAHLAGHSASSELLDAKLATELMERVARLDLTPTQRLRAARVLEGLGRYADAEDALFEAIEADQDDPGPVDAGIGFYQRLLARGDGELEAGDLPRDEVKSGLAELLRRQVQLDPDLDLDEGPEAR